jgi:hypothetical protein
VRQQVVLTRLGAQLHIISIASRIKAGLGYFARSRSKELRSRGHGDVDPLMPGEPEPRVVPRVSAENLRHLPITRPSYGKHVLSTITNGKVSPGPLLKQKQLPVKRGR